MVKKVQFLVFLLLCSILTSAQNIDEIIKQEEVERIEKALSSDDMQGRGLGSVGIAKAADFISTEFKKAGIQNVTAGSYFQDFSFLRLRITSAKGTLDGKELDPKNIVVLSVEPEVIINETSGYEKIKIGDSDLLYDLVKEYLKTDKKYLLIVDESQRQMFNSLKLYLQNNFGFKATIVAVLTSDNPTRYSIEYQQSVKQQFLKNVVGILPGNKLKDEYIIFSAHYDHLGIGKANSEGDSIYNGANDDASGVTAVIMLAKYFSENKSNERTLIFAAFTAEEPGGIGSRYFSQQYDPTKVMAMFNIEMIGTESKWGTNSAFITGYERTNMGKVLERNLEGTNFRFYPDPYPNENLFFRSDNATLARLGVPAHTISTSKMDSEKFYHTQDDEIATLDMRNMTEIIKAIALSSASIVSGADSPTRVHAGSIK